MSLTIIDVRMFGHLGQLWLTRYGKRDTTYRTQWIIGSRDDPEAPWRYTVHGYQIDRNGNRRPRSRSKPFNGTLGDYGHLFSVWPHDPDRPQDTYLDDHVQEWLTRRSQDPNHRQPEGPWYP